MAIIKWQPMVHRPGRHDAPHLDGAFTIEAQVRIRSIAISGDHREPIELTRAGFVEFVPKPLDPIALCDRIRAHRRPRS